MGIFWEDVYPLCRDTVSNSKLVIKICRHYQFVSSFARRHRLLLKIVPR